MIAFALLALALQVAQPRWAALHDIRSGGPVDDVLAQGGECRPGDATLQTGAASSGPGFSAVMFAQMTFGYALPHVHQPRDSMAIRRALSVGTMCWATLDNNTRATATAVDRRLVAVMVYFRGDSGGIPADSVRRLAYAAWGRPTHHSPTLDTWSSSRYRSYFLVPYQTPPRGTTVRIQRYTELIMIDIAACTALDHRVHRAGAAGEAGDC